MKTKICENGKWEIDSFKIHGNVSTSQHVVFISILRYYVRVECALQFRPSYQNVCVCIDFGFCRLFWLQLGSHDIG